MSTSGDPIKNTNTEEDKKKEQDESSSSGAETANEDFVNTKPRKKKLRVSTITSDDSPISHKLRLKVPPFSPDEPEIWFALLEGQFTLLDIEDDTMRYTYVTNNLDMHHAKAVKDIITKPPAENRYIKIKTELIRRLSASKEKKVKQLLSHEELGDRKPSEFLRHLLDLAGPDVPEDFVLTIWRNRLPNNIQTILVSQRSQDLDHLSELADQIQDISSPCSVASTSASSRPNEHISSEIAELKKMVEKLASQLDRGKNNGRQGRQHRSSQRQQSSTPRQRSRSNSSYRKYPVCWYHSKFGPRASQCIKPCDFKKAENTTGSR